MTSAAYNNSIPTFITGLETLSALLTKAESAGKLTGDLTTLKLINDMKGLPFQIQACCNVVTKTIERVGGGVHPDTNFPHVETTYADVQECLSKVTRWVTETGTAELFAGKDETLVDLQLGDVMIKLPVQDYVSRFAVPNFYFHFVTAYGILRANGVDIGKRDYLENFLSPFIVSQ